MAYPDTIDSFSTKNNGDVLQASHINDLQTALSATQTELGTLPKGSYASIKARLDALENSIAPIGSIRPTPTRTATNSNWHLLDGAALSRTTYSELFNKIVPNLGTCTITIATPAVLTLTAHGLFTGESFYLTTTGALPTGLSANVLYYAIVDNADTLRIASSYANALAGTAINTTGSQSGTHSFYFCPFGLGDGSTTFNLPDFRGAVLSMRGTSIGYTQNVTRAMGAKQDDAMQGHRHNLLLEDGGIGSAGAYRIPYSGTPSYAGKIGGPVTDGTNGTPRTANETRMKNVAVNYEIRVL